MNAVIPVGPNRFIGLNLTRGPEDVPYEDSAALAMAVSGSSISLTGDEGLTSNNSGAAPYFLANYVATPLPLPSGLSTGEAVWASGQLQSGPMPTGDLNAILVGLVISGSDVCFSGATSTCRNNNIYYNAAANPVYWKSNKLNVLPLNGYGARHVHVMTTLPYRSRTNCIHYREIIRSFDNVNFNMYTS